MIFMVILKSEDRSAPSQTPLKISRKINFQKTRFITFLSLSFEWAKIIYFCYSSLSEIMESLGCRNFSNLGCYVCSLLTDKYNPKMRRAKGGTLSEVAFMDSFCILNIIVLRNPTCYVF